MADHGLQQNPKVLKNGLGKSARNFLGNLLDEPKMNSDLSNDYLDLSDGFANGRHSSERHLGLSVDELLSLERDVKYVLYSTPNAGVT